MTNPNTSFERVNISIQRSERIYDEIDQVVDGEARYRTLLRLGVNAVAIALREGKTLSEAGVELLNIPTFQPSQPGPLDTLANEYADVPRATLDRNGNPETDARHVIHLIKLGVPYAEEHYPWLDIPRIAAGFLLHDFPEARAGDTASLGMTLPQKRLKDLREAQAIEELREEYGAAWPELIEHIEAYEALETPEDRFVKTYDKKDPGYTHLYNNGFQLHNYYGYSRERFIEAFDEATERMQPYSGEFPLIMEDRDELNRRVLDAAYPKAA